MARPLSDTARSKMIASTQELVLERGLPGFSIDEVARRSGVAKSTIYRHFASGDELLIAAIAELIDDMPDVDTGSLRSDLRAMACRVLTTMDSPQVRRLFASMLSRAMVDPDFGALVKTAKDQRHSQFRIVIQRGIARGEVDPSIDVELAMHLVQGPFMARRLIDDEPMSPDDVDRIIDLGVKALAPTTAQA